MAIVAVNGGGNTPQGQVNGQPHGDIITFAPVPAPGAEHGEELVRFFASLPAVQQELPAADVVVGNFVGTEQTGWADIWL